MYHIGGNSYQLVKDHKNAWNFEVFRERYSEVLDRYDYIVGDWGYNQLRLKGFFKEANNKGAKEASISHLHDYLNEYCNFGCAYFIIEKLAARKGQPGREQDPDDALAEPEAFASAKLPEAEKTGDAAEIKPRVHYHRAGTETNRHRGVSLQDRGSGNQAEAKPRNPEAKGGREPEGRGEQRSRGQEGRHRPEQNRQRDQERPRDSAASQPKAQREPGGKEGERRGARDPQGRGREHENKGKPQQQNQEQRGKGPYPGRNKGQNRDRNRDRDRNREPDKEKEKAEPLA